MAQYRPSWPVPIACDTPKPAAASSLQIASHRRYEYGPMAYTHNKSTCNIYCLYIAHDTVPERAQILAPSKSVPEADSRDLFQLVHRSSPLSLHVHLLPDLLERLVMRSSFSGCTCFELIFSIESISHPYNIMIFLVFMSRYVPLRSWSPSSRR